MTRLSDTFVAKGRAYAADSIGPVVDLNKGGQNGGLMTDYPAYVSTTPYVQRNLICKVLAVPRGFDFLPQPEVWREAVKAFFELHPKSIDIGNTKLTVESVETPFGGSGMKLEAPSNVTQGVPEPSFVHVEREGRPFTKMLVGWVTYLIMDPTTKIPRVVTIPANRGKIPDLLPDFIAATCLFFEPNSSFTTVEKAWLITNMYPKETPDEIGKMDRTSAGELLEFTTPFTGLTQVSYGVKVLAQQFLDEMVMSGANPNTRPAFIQKVDAYIKDVGTGVKEQLDQAAQTAIAIPA